MDKKTLTISTLVLLALAIAGGFWFAQNGGGEVEIAQKVEITETTEAIIATTFQKEEIAQNEIDASSWKTYTNKEHGFSLRYPEGWSISVGKEVGDLVIVLTNKSDGQNNYIKFYPVGGGIEASERPYMPTPFLLKIGKNTKVSAQQWESKSGVSDFGYNYDHRNVLVIAFISKEIAPKWKNDARIKISYTNDFKDDIFEILELIEFVK